MGWNKSTGSSNNCYDNTLCDGNSDWGLEAKEYDQGSTYLEEIPEPVIILQRTHQQTRVSNYLNQPECSSITTNKSMCTFIESNLNNSRLPRSNVAIGIPLDYTVLTKLTRRSDDEDEEAFLNGDRTDVWDETLGYHYDEEQYDCEFDKNDEQSELENDTNGTGGVLVHAQDRW